MILAALLISLLPCSAIAGAAEDFLAACSSSTDVPAVLSQLESDGWDKRTELAEPELAILTEGLVLLQADLKLSGETRALEEARQAKLLAQLIKGVAGGILPGAQFVHEAEPGNVALVLADPTQNGKELRCYFAGQAAGRFTDLIDQLRDYKMLRTDAPFFERAPLDTTTRATRATSVIARFKPEAEAAGFGQKAGLAIYVLTRSAEAG